MKTTNDLKVLLLCLLLSACGTSRELQSVEYASSAPPASPVIEQPPLTGRAPPPPPAAQPPGAKLDAAAASPGSSAQSPRPTRPAARPVLAAPPPPAPEAATDASAPAPLPSAALTKGNAAYFVPRRMTVGESSRVDLWISRKASLEDLTKSLAEHLNLKKEQVKLKTSSTQPVAGELQGIPSVFTGEKMTARLRGGDDFIIDPKEPMTKLLTEDDMARWNWRVTPRHANANLTLVIEASVEMGAQKDAFPSITETVVVSPSESWLQRFIGSMKQLVTDVNTILTTLGVAGGLGGAIAYARNWLGKRGNQQANETDRDAA